MRLFQRKHAWLRVAKLDYPKIAIDLKPAIKELQAIQFLQGGMYGFLVPSCQLKPETVYWSQVKT